MRCRGFSLRLALAVGVGVMAAALFYVSVLIAQGRAALETVSADDTVWVTTEGALEAAQLEAAISALQVPGSGLTHDNVAVRYGVVRERIAALKQRKAAAVLGQVAPLIEHIEQPTVAAQALHLLLPLNPELVRLAALSHARNVQATQERLSALVFLQRLFAGLLGALLACLFGLAGLLAHHNRTLKRTHDEVQSLTRISQLAPIRKNFASGGRSERRG